MVLIQRTTKCGSPAVSLIIEPILKPRQVRLLVLPRHQEPVRRRERLTQDEGQVADSCLVSAVPGADVDQVSPVQDQHLAFVPNDLAIDLAEFSQENADFLVHIFGRHQAGILVRQQVDDLTDEGVKHLEQFTLRALVAHKPVESVGDALELVSLPSFGFPPPGEIAAVEGRHLGADCQLGFHDLRGESGNVAVLGRGQVQHRRVVPHEVVDLVAGLGRDAQVLGIGGLVGADAAFCDTDPFRDELVFRDGLLQYCFVRD
ncbi:hypothetical protein PG984_010121 [Apiospora sp. TS-2023a]